VGMDELKENQVFWWASVSIRISHSSLDPDVLSKTLVAVPEIAQHPGESRVRYKDCISAGYWCATHREDYPQRPSSVIEWAETFVSDRFESFSRLIEDGYDIDVYVAIYSNVMAIGFELPRTSSLSKLGIRIGLEYFSR